MKEKDIIKKVPLDYMTYAEKLKEWLIQNQKEYFEKYKARAWNDFDYWHNIQTTRRELVMPDEHMVIDRFFEGEHMLVICRISKSKKNQRCKHIVPVIKVSELDNWRNGYFLLPDLTI
jgi:hypothetical protein